MPSDRLNCWEYMHCGREPGGRHAGEKGVCPAAADAVFDGMNRGRMGGRICWLVAGTFCDGPVQATFAAKKASCRECLFYKTVQAEEAEGVLHADRIAVFAASHRGLVRPANEDRYLIRQLDDNSLLLAVADGLGGQEAGDQAAEILRGKLAALSSVPRGREEEMLAGLAVATDRLILRIAEERPELAGMGTTLLCVLLRDGMAHWVHVGDSRFSILREHKLLPVTRDQNLARFLLEEGAITREEVAGHYARHVLDQALGSALEKPETGTLPVQERDLLLLSTDGLHSEVPEETINEVLNSGQHLQAKVNALVSAALAAGGKDNVTIVAAQLAGPKCL